ncbi:MULTISPECIES: 16S rRNA (guanine(527)-N(7))-methyltransferase RsmG [Actinokineospora]|uniref:Ribosomal RNA small subunit methyltransferase G n=1 Tax=Actinokineospora fastidiosa TaxID=1816 RepID=A0A918L860_9PSEU|nr:MULTISPECIES: 16S rRNA (guanine(527)-N(7))-methyltransferase RsmG [Actinokineospora]UVS82712.1 Ribosomal RNA small subunit methyltransferase G [Actinokineospora sp. UTMC 2448]GGS19043.1 ribosomal RNA small subunit methyltransferase G [Actinokineospora fastidiosa]
MTNLDRDRVSSVFGDRTGLAERFVELLAVHGVARGLIGPREVDRLWDRHVLNSAVIAEVLPERGRVVDVGSGAGLPGIPLAIARPDLSITLVEPMARRVAWLDEVVETLGLSSVAVVRGRAEEPAVRDRVTGADVVTARAVAPLGKLSAWCLPLLRTGGRMVALKGASAAEEIERDRAEIRRAGGGDPRIERCGATVVDPPTTVVVVERLPRRTGKDQRARRG